MSGRIFLTVIVALFWGLSGCKKESESTSPPQASSPAQAASTAVPATNPATVAPPPPAKDPLEGLSPSDRDVQISQGVWTLQSLNRNGQPAVERPTDIVKISINGYRMAATTRDGRSSGPADFEIDGTSSPKRVTVYEYLAPSGANYSNRYGAYELSSDAFTLSLLDLDYDVEPPTTTAPGDKRVVYVFRRGEHGKALSSEELSQRPLYPPTEVWKTLKLAESLRRNSFTVVDGVAAPAKPIWTRDAAQNWTVTIPGSFATQGQFNFAGELTNPFVMAVYKNVTCEIQMTPLSEADKANGRQIKADVMYRSPLVRNVNANLIPPVWSQWQDRGSSSFFRVDVKEENGQWGASCQQNQAGQAPDPKTIPQQ